ncbi:rod shape-determining protein MreC [Guyparkeria hydrothermalis]|uniref:Cell shape-determining protein MreC n=1 Tax=Guyparkeria halophila TaxID=47960 RepID=A0A6I6CZ20_9GAMM|nr:MULTISPECIES: rod shape-determining protein MreC [Guyparkeria]MCL7750058.1 rod shape-determining protein MreC [Guyparkeria hydrothermalis]QGT78660.1 rod shape-determining protein MreC [Guyparkeria halophila]TKA89791.1 rod shape-determining protein MreC [Guyparkeria sp. SB14A]
MALFDSHRPGLNLLLVLVVVSIALMSLDRIGTRWVGQLDQGLGGATDGIIKTIHQPVVMARGIGQWFVERRELHAEVERLREENTLLRGQMQQFVALQREVDELRAMLDGEASTIPGVLLARRIGHPPSLRGNLFTIGRGFGDDVRPGDPVIDAHGVVGQILRSTRFGATVIQLTSRDHMLSVILGDTGRSALLRGTGDRQLVVERVPERTAIEPGDLLTTSGIDTAFPRGYPVARVSTIEMDEAQGFIRLIAEPVADLERLDHVLVITEPPDAPDASPKAGGTPGETLERPAVAPAPDESATTATGESDDD